MTTEKRLEQYRRSHKKHREERAPKEKEYREKHKEHYKEIYHNYQIEHGKERTKKHYEKHKEQRKESSRKKSRELTKWMDEIKTGMGCSICGDNEFGFLLEFHHLNGDKKIGGHQLRFIYHGNQRYFDELEKCMLLCQKCHRIVHHQERHYNEPEWVIKYNEYITRFNK
jgi:hypothetical protein